MTECFAIRTINLECGGLVLNEKGRGGHFYPSPLEEDDRFVVPCVKKGSRRLDCCTYPGYRQKHEAGPPIVVEVYAYDVSVVRPCP